MACDLEGLFGPVAARLPETQEDDACPFALSADTLPRAAASMSTDRLVITKTHHNYDCYYRRDALHFHASKATYCHLGLLVAAVLFAPGAADVVLSLVHPASDIRRIVVRRDEALTPGEVRSGYHAQPLVLGYYPESVAKHPFEGLDGKPDDLPGFFLTNADDLVTSDDEWRARDTVVGFGRDVGMAHLVELLLNISRLASDRVEIEMEGEGGFRGVAPLSCEVRLWLPGSFGWDDSLFPQTATT